MLDGDDLPEKALIGGKAWSVARMHALQLPVPPAFVITTRACAEFLATGDLPTGLREEIHAGLVWLEARTGRRFGAERTPLLVSVRSGAMISMPGMMDTVLNLGMNPQTEAALADESGSAAFARDTHRRFLELYARIVLRATLPDLEPEATPAQWQAQIADAVGTTVPEAPEVQIEGAVRAVFESWNSRRARRYREHHGIAHDLGTAVTIQAMVFGNLDAHSGTGVLFSRNPLTGDPAPYGEYLARAQGEDVVSGRHTPEPLSALAATLPAVHQQLLDAAQILERANGDVQDIEFTVQKGTLYLLQSRAAKRGPAAAVRFAVDMVAEGRIDEATALSRVSGEQVRALLSPRLALATLPEALIQGEPACQGVGVGLVVTSSDEAERRAKAGEAVVLARDTTSPDDVHGMLVARAVITEQGGSTSHAAVVSRALGVPCVVGCGAGRLTSLAGRHVTVDGASGRVFEGALPVVSPEETDEPLLATLMAWAASRVTVSVVLESAAEAARALDLDTLKGGEDPAQIAGLMAGAEAVKGAVLNSDDGVRAALAAGARVLVVRHRLPALLAAMTPLA